MAVTFNKDPLAIRILNKALHFVHTEGESVVPVYSVANAHKGTDGVVHVVVNAALDGQGNRTVYGSFDIPAGPDADAVFEFMLESATVTADATWNGP